MLLLIDCGNTNIVFAISKNNKIIKQWRINTNIKRTADEYSVWLIKLLEIENLRISSYHMRVHKYAHVYVYIHI